MKTRVMRFMGRLLQLFWTKGASTPFVVRLIGRLTGRLHIRLYRTTKGRIGGRFLGGPVVLLTVTGRKSGQKRTTPLLYLRDGNDIVVVASSGGLRLPEWWRNLQADPLAEVEVGDRRVQVCAEEASAQERERLWPLLNRMYAGYEGYQRKAVWQIPVVKLHPQG